MMTALSEIAAVATSSTFLGFLQDSLQMSPSDWDELFAGVDDEQHEKHAILVQEDEPSEALYYIVSGMVTVERGSLQLKLLAPGDWFGEFSVLLGQATATASIVAQKSVVVRRLSRAALLKRIWATPTLGVILIYIFTKKKIHLLFILFTFVVSFVNYNYFEIVGFGACIAVDTCGSTIAC